MKINPNFIKSSFCVEELTLLFRCRFFRVPDLTFEWFGGQHGGGRHGGPLESEIGNPKRTTPAKEDQVFKTKILIL